MAVSTAQPVTPERQHTIQQSGSGAPVVSVTGSGEQVRSERTVQQDGQVVRTMRQPSAESTTVPAQSVQAQGTQASQTQSQQAVSPRDRANAGVVAALQERQQMTRELNRQVFGTTYGDSSSTQQPRQQQARQQQQRNQRQQQQQQQQHPQPIVIGSFRVSQSAEASGDNAKVAQSVIIAIDRQVADLLDQQSQIRSSTSARGSGSVAAQQDIRGKDGNVDIRTQASAERGQARTAQELNTAISDQKGQRQLSFRQQETARGQPATVAQRVQARQETGLTAVQSGSQQTPQTGSGGQSQCMTHTHSHSTGSHHGQFHIGTHTHQHTHCPG